MKLGGLVGCGLTLAWVASSAAAQSVVPIPVDTAELGRAPYSRMHMKLERTIFKADVLTLDVWLGQEDAARLGQLIRQRGYSNALADSVADVAIHSEDALVRIEFLRDVTLDQFLEGAEENLRHVLEAGIIGRSHHAIVVEGLPRWFGFLEERGIREGDQLLYRVRGDSLTTRYRAVGGELLLDQTDVGPDPRLAMLGSYFVRESEFSDGLIKSLFEDRGQR